MGVNSKRQDNLIIISIYQMKYTKLYIVVYIGMFDRNIGRCWHLWSFLRAGAEVDKFLLEVGELVDDHPSLWRAGGQPLAQCLQDVRYGLALLPLTNRRWPRPRRPAQGGVVERQVGVLRRGGGGQDAVTLSHLGESSRVKSRTTRTFLVGWENSPR